MSYNSKDVRVLGEIEHIRLNSGMYIGSTETPTHLIEEALDNALDEALAGYAKIIAVFIDTKNHVYSVLDNGRGIPMEDNVPVTISCKMFSGAKFQDKKDAYKITAGLHGIGLVAVNAFSSSYNIYIYRNKKKAVFNFKDAKLKYSNIESFTDNAPFSTKIEFTPDKKYFEKMIPDINRIRARLTTASAEFPDDITFLLVVDEKKEVIKRDMITHFATECISKPENPIEINNIISKKYPEKFQVLFTYEDDGPAAPKIVSSVNLLPVRFGGTHINYFFDILKDFFITKAKKYDYKFQPNDCLYKLRASFMLSLIETKLLGQTKDSLDNSKTYYDERFTKDLKQQLETTFTKNEGLLKDYLAKFQLYRETLDSKKLVVTNTSRRASTKLTKLLDCTSRNGELYIVEGDSAGGSIKQTRNPQLHAILPLKGKSIPNVTTKKDSQKNVEISEIIMAAGTGYGPHFDINKLRYSRIVCATDADHDGNHIACLVTMAIATHSPEVIKSGRYYLARTPLFAINENKVFIPLWTQEELEQARKDKRKISRFKGLGELNPSQLKICLLDEQTRHHIQIQYTNNMDELIKLFSLASEKRTLIGEDEENIE